MNWRSARPSWPGLSSHRYGVGHDGWPGRPGQAGHDGGATRRFAAAMASRHEARHQPHRRVHPPRAADDGRTGGAARRPGGAAVSGAGGRGRTLRHAGRGEPDQRAPDRAAARAHAGPVRHRGRRQPAQLARPADRRADHRCDHDAGQFRPHRAAGRIRARPHRARAAPPPALHPDHGARVPHLERDGGDRGQRARPSRRPGRCRHHADLSLRRATRPRRGLRRAAQSRRTWPTIRTSRCPVSGSGAPAWRRSTISTCAAPRAWCSSR